MNLNLTILPKGLLSIVLLIVAGQISNANAANFNYSQVQLQVGYATFDEPIIIANGEAEGDATEDQHRHLRVLGLSAAYQFPNSVFIGASATEGSSATELSQVDSTADSLYIGYAIGLRNRMDLYATLGSYNSAAKACNDVECNSMNDHTFGYDFGLRGGVGYWFEWGMNLKTLPYKKFGESSTLGVHGAVWIDRHSSLVSNWIRNDDGYTLTLGYRFSY